MPGKPAIYRAPGAGSARGYEARRGSPAARGYGPAWAKASAAHLRANPLCIGCLALGRTVAATLTDHVKPASDFPDLFWAQDNWQPSCSWHHSAIKQRLEALYRAGEVSGEALRLDSSEALRLARE